VAYNQQSVVVQRLGYLAFTQETRVRFPATELFHFLENSYFECINQYQRTLTFIPDTTLARAKHPIRSASQKTYTPSFTPHVEVSFCVFNLSLILSSLFSHHQLPPYKLNKQLSLSLSLSFFISLTQVNTPLFNSSFSPFSSCCF
jgi:hypothetical protein